MDRTEAQHGDTKMMFFVSPASPTVPDFHALQDALDTYMSMLVRRASLEHHTRKGQS
jgi:hypothetical protein